MPRAGAHLTPGASLKNGLTLPPSPGEPVRGEPGVGTGVSLVRSEPTPWTVLGGPEDHSGVSSDLGLVRIWVSQKQSRHTKRAYQHDATDLLQFMARRKKTLRELTASDLISWSEKLPGALTTRARAISAIKSLLTFGYRTGYLPYNVGAILRVPQAPDRLVERILIEEDVLRLIQVSKQIHGGEIIPFLYYTGARVSEACELTWDRVLENSDGSAVITFYGKGEKTRHVYVSADYARTLLSFRGDAPQEAFVFQASGKDSMSARTALRIVKKAIGMLGLKRSISPHWFRHANASHSLNHGAPISVVKEALGHRTLETTGRYLHANVNDGPSKYLTILK